MLLRSTNMPVNELLTEGFDMQYVAQFSRPQLCDRVGPHFTDRHVHISITWPYREKEGRFGNGNKLIRVIQKKDDVLVTDIADVCILERDERLQEVALTEVPHSEQTQAVLRLVYGTDKKYARHKLFPIAVGRPKLLH